MPFSPALAAAILTGTIPTAEVASQAAGTRPQARPFLEGGAFMIAWLLGFFAGPIVLAGFVVYLCRGPRRHRSLTREQITELQVLADIERHGNLH